MNFFFLCSDDETRGDGGHHFDGHAIGYFHAASIDVVCNTPLEHDIVIVDEAIGNLGNLFVQTAQWLHNLTTEAHQNYGEKREVSESFLQVVAGDELHLEQTIHRLRKARLLFYVDSALTHASMKALESLYHDFDRVPLEKWLQGVDSRHVRCRLRAQTQEHDHVICNYCQKTTWVHITPIRKIALYDPDLHHRVFTKIEHYQQKAHLIQELLRELLEKGKKNIVYVSSSHSAHLLAREVCIASKSPSRRIPSIGRLTQETVQKDRTSYILLKDKNNETVLTIVTLIVSSALSFIQWDNFHTAYAFVELGRGLPPPVDMVHLSARVRSIATKVLKFNVVCAEPVCDLLGWLYKDARTQDRIVDTTVCNYHDANMEEFKQANEMASTPALARAVIKQMFVKAFTHVIDRYERLVPSMVDVESRSGYCCLPPYSNKRKCQEMLSENHMDIAWAKKRVGRGTDNGVDNTAAEAGKNIAGDLEKEEEKEEEEKKEG